MTLSGNSLEGSLPTLVQDFYPLHTLILSNNLLTGTLPQWISDSQNLTYLDVSFNRFSGDFPYLGTSEVTNLTTRYLQVNLFSGNVPHSLLTVEHIDMLEGNIVNCNLQRNDIPENDPNMDSYICGTDGTNIALGLFGSVLAVVLGTLWLLNGRRCQLTAIELNTSIESLSFFGKVSKAYQDCFRIGQLQRTWDITGWYVRSALFMSIFVLLPLFLVVGLATETNRTYLHRYVWQISGLYLQGWSAWVIVLLLALILYVAILLYKRPWKNIFTMNQLILNTEDCRRYWKILTTKETWFYVIFVLLNGIIVLTVNSLYVAAVVSNEFSIIPITIFAILLSLFKILW
jgi:hypothetical protein